MNYPWMNRFDKAAGDAEDLARIEALASKLSTRIRKAFLKAIADLQDKIDLKAIADLMAAGRTRDAINLVDAQLLANGLVPLAYAVTGTTIEAGQTAAAGINAVRALSGLNVQFGVTNPATVDYLQRYEFDLIAQLTQQARAAVAASVTAGVTDGRNPIDIARDVRANIGLTDFQTEAVRRYRRSLENLKRDAVDRALRDKRFDPTVLRAIANQKPLKRAQIDKMVERYRQKYLKYRAETIARTEAIRSLNAGNLQAWKQAISDGKITAEQVTRKWVFTHDSRTRHAHRTIPALNPDGVGIDEPFKSELGPILFPGDPKAAAANTINCFTGDMRPTFVSPVKRLMRRWYVGPLVRLRFEGGREIAVTPNHPMLTPIGMKAAGLINEGDDLIYCAGADCSVSRPDPQAPPATFAQIFDLASVVFPTERVAGNSMNFHGDGIDANIDIVSPEGLLPDWLEASCGQRLQKLFLAAPDLMKASLIGDRPGGACRFGILLATAQFMRRCSKSLAIVAARLCHTAKHAFRSIGHDNAALCEATLDLGSQNSEPRRYRFDTVAGRVKNSYLGMIERFSAFIAAAATRPDRDTFAPEAQKPKAERVAKALDDNFERLTAGVSLSRVVEVVRQEVFTGHVYNTETETGIYLTNGISVCNCRCTQIIRFKALPGVQPAAAALPAPQQTTSAPIIVTQTPEEKLEEARAAAKAFSLQEGRRSGVENLRWVDLDTSELEDDMNTGSQKHVDFTPALDAALRDQTRRIEVHHNHPGDSSLSGQDLRMIEEFPGLESVYAYGHAGSTYFASGAKPGTYTAFNKATNAGTSLPFLNAVAARDGTLAGKLYSHARVSALQSAGLIGYKADLAPYLQAEIDADTAGWEATVKALTAKIGKAGPARLDKLAPAMIDPPDSPWATIEEWQAFLIEMLTSTVPNLDPFVEMAKAKIDELSKTG